MREAALGDNVRVHYTGTLASGDMFDSSRDGDPMTVVLGAGRLIEAFEKALLGMTPGASKQIEVQPEDAYGQRHDSLVHVVAREQLPPGLDPQLGMTLESANANGQPIQFTVVALDDDRVTLDANHPLAGKVLTFDIELVDFIDD